MKKLLLVSLMVFLTSIVYAQDLDLPEEEGASLESGELLIEITSSPFGRDGVTAFESSNTVILNFGQFRARYVLNEQLVPRLGIWFSVDDNRSGLSSPDEVVTVTEMMFTPGIEYHFINQNGFTSYVALDALISHRSILLESATDSDVAGLSFIPSSNNVSASLGDRGFLGFGAYVAAGADYHFSSRFYIGAEIGFQAMTGTTQDVEVDGTVIQEGFTFFDAGVNTMNSFRIGFKLL